jgi:hypothetical protein
MITTRSIRPDEAGCFAAPGDATIRDSLLAAWDDGTSRPDWTLVAEERLVLLRVAVTPGVERLQQPGARLTLDVDLAQVADGPNRPLHLVEVRGAAVTDGQVVLESEPILSRERTFEVIGDELDELRAGQAHPGSCHFGSSSK